MKFLKSLWAHLWCVPAVVAFLLMVMFAYVAAGKRGALAVCRMPLR
jgi:hypothetical protein